MGVAIDPGACTVIRALEYVKKLAMWLYVTKEGDRVWAQSHSHFDQNLSLDRPVEINTQTPRRVLLCT